MDWQQAFVRSLNWYISSAVDHLARLRAENEKLPKNPDGMIVSPRWLPPGSSYAIAWADWMAKTPATEWPNWMAKTPATEWPNWLKSDLLVMTHKRHE